LEKIRLTSKPLNIVLFYENFNVVILLDNQLNETQKINFLENTSAFMVSGIASKSAVGLQFKPTNWPFDYIKNEYKTISTPFQKT
jgi:hypothetical protein